MVAWLNLVILRLLSHIPTRNKLSTNYKSIETTKYQGLHIGIYEQNVA